MTELVNFLQSQGEMEFGAFVTAARAAGLRPELWKRAKSTGLLHTWINANGDLRIAAGAAPGGTV